MKNLMIFDFVFFVACCCAVSWYICYRLEAPVIMYVFISGFISSMMQPIFKMKIDTYYKYIDAINRIEEIQKKWT